MLQTFELIKLKTISAAEGVAGANIDLRPEQLGVSSRGAPAYLVGLYFDLVVQADTNAALASAVDPDHMRTIITDFNLKAGGHDFISGKNGLDLYLDTLLRTQSPTLGGADDSTGQADATASDVDGTLRQVFYLTNPANDLDGSKSLDGAIPCKVFQGGSAGSRLAFTIGTNLTPSLAANWTLDHVTGDVWAIVAYGAKVQIPTPWKLEARVETDNRPVVAARGALEYLAIADRFDESNVYDEDQVDYTDVKVELNGVQLSRQALTALIAARLHSAIVFPFAKLPGAADLSLTAPAWMPLLHVAPGAPRSAMPVGVVKVIIDGRGSRTKTTLRYRDTGALDVNSDYFKAMLRALGVKQGDRFDFRRASSAGKQGTPVDPVLDLQVWWEQAAMAGDFAVAAGV